MSSGAPFPMLAHGSNLQPSEDRMATHCRVCLGIAESAYEMSQKGITIQPGSRLR